MIDLLRTTSTVLYRSSGSDRYLTDDGKWVESSTIEEIPIKCNIQPYQGGEEQRDLPDGIRLDEALSLFTKTKVIQADDRSKVESDEIEIEGVRYECFGVKKFVGFGLISDNYECLFIKKDKG